MKFKVEIKIKPIKELLDPAGRTAEKAMKTINIDGIENIRIGKLITMSVEAYDEKSAEEKVKQACQKLLFNPIMEEYTFNIKNTKNDRG